MEKKYKTEDSCMKKFIFRMFLDSMMIDSKTVITQVQELQVLFHDIHAKKMELSESFHVPASSRTSYLYGEISKAILSTNAKWWTLRNWLSFFGLKKTIERLKGSLLFNMEQTLWNPVWRSTKTVRFWVMHRKETTSKNVKKFKWDCYKFEKNGTLL